MLFFLSYSFFCFKSQEKYFAHKNPAKKLAQDPKDLM